jgi:hypothetical protein
MGDAMAQPESDAAAMGTRYPVLTGFFGAFFHQDWSVDHATPDDVVTAFIADSRRDELATASNELQSLLALRLGDADLEQVLDKELGSDYVPSDTGGSNREWLEHVASRIRTARAGQGSVDMHHD